MEHAWLGPPIDARPLFRPEHAALYATLRDLTPAEWGREVVPGWSVHDLAAHLLGDYLGRIPGRRERRAPAPDEPLEAFIHRINQEWVDSHRQRGSVALVEAIDQAAPEVADHFETRDPFRPALGVSWAGAVPAPGWLDAAREFTEYWAHRQQIRHVIGQRTDPQPRPFSVVLDTFMRALPHTLRDVVAPAGTQLRLSATGPAGSTWTVTAVGRGRWSLAEPPVAEPDTIVTIDPETAWRLCVRSVEPDTALARARVDGDHDLAAAALRIVSIVY
ncbi:maleylpyruvate isomerase N-terminal domain-containing protein [Streptomyces hainanensis]|uniref:Maleylpyruvate isomerase family mycothiol-dependent enzyme n=1 Tax=Streptomyces hainanensis TaxID=402648 RepID=A0A4R4TC02_9ACTN|nr:maleylpyruvate isomerase N-terminal domain-containing protein [Streptomyces hainanensis]TDC75018.1 maleylpyruvate isomerase family mycothiol-dependent enzyme [Streptomyces hainanensis]